MLLATTGGQLSTITDPQHFGLLLGLLAVMAIVPFVLTLTTSFAKIVVVLGLVRQALGTQQTPPNTIVTGIALILSIHVMWPVADATYANYRRLSATTGQAAPAGQEGSADERSKDPVSFGTLVAVIRSAQGPMHDFLARNSYPSYVEHFRQLSEGSGEPNHAGPSLREDLRSRLPEAAAAIDDLVIYAPAFLLSELTKAFQIGFLLFIPFLVLDLVVGNVLLAMGMQMLNPQTVSLPLKLLLFVVIDGWYLILDGLVRCYR